MIIYEIFSKEDNKILEKYSEDYDKDLNFMPLALNNQSLKTFNHDIYWSYGGQTLTFRSTVVTSFYYYNYRHINTVEGKNFKIISNGLWTLEDSMSVTYPLYPVAGKFPTVKLQVSVSGVPTIQKQQALESGYNIDF